MRREPAPTSLQAQHTPSAVRRRLGAPAEPSYLRDFIYGAIDGTITTFAVVAGVEGASLDATVVIILGGANLLADGLSMAASNFLGSRAERQHRELIRAEERRHIELVPDGEREELRQIFAAKGFEGHELERVVDVISADLDVWTDTMMSEELGYATTEPNELRAATSTFAAFVAVGFLPLIPFVYDLAAPGSLDGAFAWSAAMAAVAFFAVGSMKARFVVQRWWRSGIETLAVGGVAATVAYFVGALLQKIA